MSSTPGTSPRPAPSRAARPRGWTGKTSGHLAGRRRQGVHQAPGPAGLVDVSRPVERDHPVRAVGDTGRGAGRDRIQERPGDLERVDHRVADEVDPVVGHALVAQVRHGVGAGREAEVGQPVGDQPVDLLGHLHVEAAQAGLHVRLGHVQLGRHERRGEGRVDVAVDDDQRRPIGQERVLEGHQEGRGLARVRPGPDAEVEVGRREPQLGEEDAGQRLVVVLPGVDHALLDARARRGHGSPARP